MKAAAFFPFRHEGRAGLLKAVRHLPEEHLAWRPPGGVHSISGWLRHIGQHEDWWIQAGVLGQHSFVPPRNAELTELVDILSYLDETRATTERLLQEWPAQKLDERRPVPSGYRGAPRGTEVSLSWIFTHLFHHELHHRGQIYLYLRLMGLEPPAF